jgi:secreted PhoX family phosphatase
VYVALTKNAKRVANTDGVNPRLKNLYGHILEMIPNAGDHASTTSRWELLLLAGNPQEATTKARYHPQTSEQGWFSCPDNLTFDPQGRLWIATDGAEQASHFSEGMYACATEGAYRALSKRFYAAPIGSETTGPCFTPDGKTLFVSIQHPSEKSDSLDALQTRWPDFNPALPPRPSVVALRKNDGGVIGG